MSVPGLSAPGGQPSMDVPALFARLPEDARSLVEQASQTAQGLGYRAYLVGGIVRDLILGRPGLDLDIAVEGDALAVAQALAAVRRGRLVTHHQFGTATLYADRLVLDLATTRTESYPSAGSLPVVKAGTIREDLHRRDFSMNAMALSLAGAPALLDPFHGLEDLRDGLVRILHEASFRDDATRMLRGVRYEQRFAFRFEEGTEALLRRDAGMLAAISGERLRYEIERILGEEEPEKPLARAAELGLLQAIHPALRWDSRLVDAFARARRVAGSGDKLDQVYAALLAMLMAPGGLEQVAQRLSFPRAWTQAAANGQRLWAEIQELAAGPLQRSRVYTMLKHHTREAVIACLAKGPGEAAEERLRLYLDEISGVRPVLGGGDILEAGVPQGPLVGEALAALTAAKLDGLVRTRGEELDFVRAWRRARGGA